MRDDAGQLADRVHLLGLPDMLVRGLLFRQIAADEKMTPDRLRPCPAPVQRHGLAGLVDVACLEVALVLPPARRPHFAAGIVWGGGGGGIERAVPGPVPRAV